MQTILEQSGSSVTTCFVAKRILLSNASEYGLPTREASSCCCAHLLCGYTSPSRSFSFAKSSIPRYPCERKHESGGQTTPLQIILFSTLLRAIPCARWLRRGRHKVALVLRSLATWRLNPGWQANCGVSFILLHGCLPKLTSPSRQCSNTWSTLGIITVKHQIARLGSVIILKTSKLGPLTRHHPVKPDPRRYETCNMRHWNRTRNDDLQYSQ